MPIENIFDQLNSPDDDLKERKHILLKHLQEQLNYRQQHPDESEQVAYDIAGLLSTDFAQSLPEGDPYLEILTLAGELELPEQHRSSASWEYLSESVKRLSTLPYKP